MQIIMNTILLLHIFKNILSAFRYKNIVFLIIIGSLSSVLFSIIGLESGKMILSSIIFSIALLLIINYNRISINKGVNIIGLSLIFLFFIYFLISYMYSPASSSSYGIWKLRQLVILAFIPSLLILFVGSIHKKEMIRIEKFILYATIITSIAIIIQFILTGSNTVESSWFNRQSVGEMNPVWLARFLSLGMIVLFAPNFDDKRLFKYILSAVLLISALLTGSKIVLFFTVPILIVYIFSNKKINKEVLKKIAIILGLLIVLALFFYSFDSTALLRRFSLESGTIGERMLMYTTAINAYLSGNTFNILFGNGAGTIGSSLGYDFVRIYPHNLIIEILYEIGIIGVFLFLLQVIFAVSLYVKGKRNWIFFAFILYILFSMTSGDLTSNNFIFILFSLYVVSNNDINIKSNKKSSIKNRLLT